MARMWTEVVRGIMSDLRNQFKCPKKSLVWTPISYQWEKTNEPLLKEVVKEAQLTPNLKGNIANLDSNVLEIGYGNGYGLGLCLKHVRKGQGKVFGLEQSEHMQWRTFKRFAVDINETDKLMLDMASKLINLPYPNDFFDCIYHVDVFYFWNSKVLPQMFREFYRVLKPGAQLLCGMELNRLKKLEKFGIVEEDEYNPLRYLIQLEPNGFKNVKLNYKKITNSREVQLISGRKPTANEVYYDPKNRFKKLEMDIKKYMAKQSLLESSQRDEELIKNFTTNRDNSQLFTKTSKEEKKSDC